ncbi:MULTISPECIES: outer membrane beta-barrel protein [Flammeovirga]|uniref:Porin family protein n=1 Tax=Flammeovirga agarivorans TaxID=2726742 RepID=A0A7X8XWZ3_9BACT|nr:MULTISPECIES: outer membrane beta-barrel protein [Flammeovirga]NLR92747.1 porin family protein [Flammeovirga agarivorans]
MKKLSIILLLSLFSLTSFAQDKLLNLGFGGGVSSVSAKEGDLSMNGIGGNYHINLFYNITPKLSVGAEYGGTVSVLAPKDMSSSDFEATSFSNISGKVLYHFGESKVRPYVGFGLGSYKVAPGKFDPKNPQGFDFGNQDIETTTTIGYAPEIGVDFGWFGLAAIYRIVPDVKVYDTMATYNSLEFRTTFNLGFIER